jgi:putative ABC transport system permease protein
VINDCNFYSLHNPIEPFVFIFREKSGRYLNIRIAENQVGNSLAFIEDTWKDLGVNHPFNYFFLDDRIAEQYGDERKMMTIFSTFSLLSLLIACMGLFALTSFMVEQKTKELGIRKILGAGNGRITLLLSKDFLILVLIGFCIAAPISFYFLSDWMSSFAYQVGITPISFIVSIVASVSLALLTIAYHTAKVSRNEPAFALKYE